ncbi:MAG TPA: hypothetical protein VH020_01695 [Stellaceae bacterium]|nr:hypothetical protein [Stellaceae bacterium]
MLGIAIIMVMPHIIIMGMPDFIMPIIRLQHSMNISFGMPSIGFISQTMPVSVISQVMPHIIGIIIIGIIMGMLFIMEFIMPGIGMPIIIGFIMPPIMVGIGIAVAALDIGLLQVGARQRVLENGLAAGAARRQADPAARSAFPPMD